MTRQKKWPVGIFLLMIMALTIIVLYQAGAFHSKPVANNDKTFIKNLNVCPPFHLYDEQDHLIDPVHNVNATAPYSPKKTCGKCHDYEKITEGFHFQQGRGEQPTTVMQARYQWTTTPGNYGGTWCSPAPLYRKLAPEQNSDAKRIDMTSFDFITATCGTCHPGGGPLELDRQGRRYDQHMQDPVSGLCSGGDNGLSGDYYKARWSDTGVLEADCMLCHLPEYNYKARNGQLELLNFRWAATQGSGLGQVTGSVRDQLPVQVAWDAKKFDADGKLSPHLVREPRNETCLNCHAKPDWKKRGANYEARNDVHLRAGLKCVDCHPAGNQAAHEKIRGKEQHQFGKGDDPSGHVRDDLDNTVRDCSACHLDGYAGAPMAEHDWLPPLHLDELSCQACHIPQRTTKSALVQLSDVYNPGAKISPPAKYIWTFYDQNMDYWNHYGELTMFTAHDQPVDISRPALARYKEKIYPVNAVHSAWPGLQTEGKAGLDQPTMKEIFTMWKAHQSDPSVYSELDVIRDDNQDGVPEVNRPEEIDAFLSAVRKHLAKNGYDLDKQQVVWVNNDRIYTDGRTYQVFDKEIFESSPFASVYKYSHNVMPAKAALGVNGCTDCHSFGAPFFNAAVVRYPFGENGKPIYEPQHQRLGISAVSVFLGAWREQVVKSMAYLLSGCLALLLLLQYGYKRLIRSYGKENWAKWILRAWPILPALLLMLVGFILLSPQVRSMILLNRLVLDQYHFYLSMFILFLAGIVLLPRILQLGRSLLFLTTATAIVLLVAGALMMLKIPVFKTLTTWSYTLFDFSLAVFLCLAVYVLLRDWSLLLAEKKGLR